MRQIRIPAARAVGGNGSDGSETIKQQKAPGIGGFFQMERGMDAATEKNRAALMSVWAALALTVVKLCVGLHTNSLGILSEALHSGLDLLAAVMTFGAVRMAARPADQGHPYGHGKIENLSALAETVLLFGVCYWVVQEGVGRLLSGASPVAPSLWGVGVMLFSMAVDCNRVRVLRRVARKHKSQALEADALHFATDILSSAVVLVGVAAVWLASALALPDSVRLVLTQADTVAALIVAIIIFRASLGMALKAINALMDCSSASERAAITEAVAALPGIAEVGQVRIRNSGAQAFVDLSVGVAPENSVEDGHRLAHAVEDVIRRHVPGADVTVHVEPHNPPADGNPFVFVQRTASAHGLGVHDVLMQQQAGRRYLELHVELPGTLPFGEAHARVARFEDSLRASWPDAEILTHLEPTACEKASQGVVSIPVSEMLWQEIARAAAGEPLVCDPHRFSVYQLPEQGICLSFHCGIADGLSLEEAHNISIRMEKRLREAFPSLGRVNIHLEPESGRQKGGQSGFSF